MVGAQATVVGWLVEHLEPSSVLRVKRMAEVYHVADLADKAGEYVDANFTAVSAEEEWKEYKAFKERYESMRFPFFVESVRKNRIANPAKILDPRSRRISHAFDQELDVESDLPDPYLECLSTGERAKRIPLPFGEPPTTT